MGKKKMETVGEGLEALQKVLTQIPTVDIPEITLDVSTEELEKRAAKVREKAKEVRAWVATVLPQLERIQQGTREAQELVADQISSARTSLEKFLGHGTPAYRRAAWLGFLSHEFSGNVTTHEELWDLVQELVQAGYLEENANGQLQVGYRHFQMAQTSCFGKEETDAVVNAFNKMCQEMERHVWQERQQKTAELRVDASNDYKALLAGQDGNYAFLVPPERYVMKDGKEWWRGGGTIRVFCRGGEIYPEDASGAIESAVREAVDMGVYVLANSLERKQPPFIKKGLAQDHARKVQLLWHLLRRAVAAAKSREEMEGLRQEFSTKAAISASDFFLNCKVGTCLVVFDGVWKTGNGTPAIRDLFLLVERKEETKDDQVTRRIQIVQIPGHLEQFFARCQDEHEEKGEKFDGLPQPLRAVLMAVFGQVQKTAQIEG